MTTDRVQMHIDRPGRGGPSLSAGKRGHPLVRCEANTPANLANYAKGNRVMRIGRMPFFVGIRIMLDADGVARLVE